MDINIDESLGYMDTEPSDVQSVDTSKGNPFAGVPDGSERSMLDADKTYADATDKTNATAQTIYENGEGAKQQTQLQDNYLNGGKTKANAKADMNVPVEDPFGNYNNMSWDDTLRLSRLADAYNSQRHWEKGKISLDGTGAENRYVQNTPVNTEESRRADITRDLSKQQSQYTLQRNNESLAYPLELQKMFDRTSDDAYRASMEIQRNWADYARRARFDAQFRDEYTAALQRYMQYWGENMRQYQQGKVSSVIWNLLADDPQFAQWMASTMTTSVTPSQDQYLANNIVQGIVNSGRSQGLTKEQIYEAFQEVMGTLTGVAGAVNGYYNTQAAIKTAQGFGGGLTGNTNYGTVK